MSKELEIIRQELDKLYDVVWGEDIQSPTTPEYREHHESIQKILKNLHQLTQKVDDMLAKNTK